MTGIGTEVDHLRVKDGSQSGRGGGKQHRTKAGEFGVKGQTKEGLFAERGGLAFLKLGITTLGYEKLLVPVDRKRK